MFEIHSYLNPERLCRQCSDILTSPQNISARPSADPLLGTKDSMRSRTLHGAVDNSAVLHKLNS